MSRRAAWAGSSAVAVLAAGLAWQLLAGDADGRAPRHDVAPLERTADRADSRTDVLPAVDAFERTPAPTDVPSAASDPGDDAFPARTGTDDGRRLQVRVLFGNAPVSDAVVELWPDLVAAGVFEQTERISIMPVVQTTDGDGRATLDVPAAWLPDGCVLARAEGRGSSGAWLVRTLAAQPGDVHELMLWRPTIVRGHVLEPDDRPVPGARVTFGRTAVGGDPAGPGYGLARRPAAVEAGADGSFEVSTDFGWFGKVVANDGDRTTASEWPDPREPLVLRMREDLVVRGQVVDDGGRGLGGVAVIVSPTDYDRKREVEAVADAAGRFSCTVTGREQYTVTAVDTAEPRRYVLRRPVVVDLEEQDAVADVLVAMLPGAEITGRVVRPDGTPVEGKDVSAQWPQPRLSFVGRGFVSGHDTTRADGSFRLAGLHPAFRYDLSSLLVLDPSSPDVRSVPAGTHGLEIVVAPDGGRCKLVVRAIDVRTGSAPKRYDLDLRMESAPGDPAGFRHADHTVTVTAGEGGVARFSHLRQYESVSLTVRPDDGPVVEMGPLRLVDEVNEVTVVVGHQAPLDVHVLDAHHQPVRGARVHVVAAELPGRLLEAPRWVAEQETGSSGIAVLTGLRPGSYLVGAEHAELGATSLARVTVEAGAPGRTTLTYGASPGRGTITVDAGNLDGEPLVGATLWAERAGEVGPPRTARTDARGHAVFAGIPPGIWILRGLGADLSLLDADPNVVVLRDGEWTSVWFVGW